jgi:hypothetical protein
VIQTRLVDQDVIARTRSLTLSAAPALSFECHSEKCSHYLGSVRYEQLNLKRSKSLRRLTFVMHPSVQHSGPDVGYSKGDARVDQ